MKYIYLFNEKSKAAVYGIGTYIKQLINLTFDKNFSFNIVNINSEKKEFTVEEEGGVKYYYIPQILKGNEIQRYYRNIFFILHPHIEMNKINDKYEFVFHFNFYQEMYLFDVLKNYYPKSKIIFTIHYFNWCFLIKGNLSYFNQIIKKKPENITNEKERDIAQDYNAILKIFNKTDKLICLSEYTKRVLVNSYQIPKEKIVKIYNGLKDEAVFLSLKNKNNLKAKYHIDKDEKIILFVGRLDDVKGADIVINSLKKIILFYHYFKCRLIIIGDGNYSKYLTECQDIWGKVTFTGHVNKETLYEFYQIADVGVLPSTHEQCSYVAIEMLSHGIPLIASTTTGLNEMISPELRYLKLKTKEEDSDVSISADECANKIILVLNKTKEERQIMANLSRKQFLKKYNLYDMQKKVISLYKYL